jgi:hypothetical protein
MADPVSFPTCAQRPVGIKSVKEKNRKLAIFIVGSLPF